MSNTFKKIIVVLLFLIGSFSYYFYQVFFSANITETKGEIVFVIPTGVTYEDVYNELYNREIINDNISFRFVAKLFDYPERVKSGKFILSGGMTNVEIVRLLRAGSQMPVRVTFNNLRFKEQLVDVFSNKLECDDGELISYLNSDKVLEKYGFDPKTIPAMFIPNTYEFYWNTSASEVMERMKKEYDIFWNDERSKKAEAIGLSKIEVATLASIVEEEQKKNTSERPRIAGVYLNRLRLGRLLQADPTIKFALGDFSIKRISNTGVDSPYNTYKYKGLPPGPICIPSIASIDAVLNFEQHDYLYFCAKGDGSFAHDFSKTFEEHKVKAARYRRELKKQNIN